MADPVLRYTIITGSALMITGFVMSVYGFINRNGTEAQQAHVYFGIMVAVLGLIIILAGILPQKVICRLPGILVTTIFVIIPTLRIIAKTIAHMHGGCRQKGQVNNYERKRTFRTDH